MKDFEPSGGFVPKVMAGVRSCEAQRRLALEKTERTLSAAPMRYALPACGILFALANFLRVAFTFLSPALGD